MQIFSHKYLVVTQKGCIFALGINLIIQRTMKHFFSHDILKKMVCMALTVFMATTAMAQYSWEKTISLTDEERQLVEQNSDFAFNLFRTVRGTENYVISPMSITYALGMLNNGAEGITREEICRVLAGGQTEGYADVATMNAFCRKMLTESALLDEKTRVAIANTIYFNGDRKTIALKSPFKNAAATYYDATPSVLSFSDAASLGIINQWVTDQTEGMIHDLLTANDMSDPNLVSFLLNAICFKGAWARPFDEKNTLNTYFGSDMKRTAMMMWQVNEFLYARNDLYESVILPYGNGSYQMTIFLPRKGKNLDDVLAALNGKNWNAADYQNYEVHLSLPRIDTDTNQDLEDVMESLGMKNAFVGNEDAHGFHEFCYYGDNEANTDVCWISLMRQKAHLKLDEKGTEAAAATVIGMVDKALFQSVEFIANRPFLYTISERSTGCIFFMGQYMGEPIKNLRHDISLTNEERKLVESNNNFAFNLFRKARGEESSIMSPLSITYALGMLNNGATGQTQQEINDVLGFGETGADAINNFCRKMLTEASTIDQETTAEIANTIYVNSGSGYELQQGFVDKANEFYDAEPQALNFFDDATIGIINQWADDHTHGMIPEIVNEQTFSRDAASLLLNALYFKGTWTIKFKKENTHDEPFNGGAEVPMMHQKEEFAYTDNGLYQAVKLPYGTGAYQMTIFLPYEGKTIGDVLDQMDGKSWQNVYGNYDVDLKLPRFKIETKLNLVQIMKDLGMPTAFSATSAEFPYFGNRDVFISDMFQKAVIDLDEEGTTAAAITGIDVWATGVPQPATFYANRPFIYIISERSTGCIFFMGQYMGEGTTGIQTLPLTPPSMEGSIYNLQGQRVSVNSVFSAPSVLPKGVYIVDGKKVFFSEK